MKRTMHQSFGLKLTLASAASALLLVSQASAQQGSQQLDSQRAQAEFQQLDANRDGLLTFVELEPRLRSADLSGAWSEQRLLDSFDKDNNDVLDQQEYMAFLVDVRPDQQRRAVVRNSAESSGRQVLVQPQQQRIEVDPKAPLVEVDQAEPKVAVTQQPAQVQVDPADPKVTVQQKEPKVIVRQAQPQVTVNVPEPEVEVIQQQPAVSVQAGKPDVDVRQQQPKVVVNQSQPQVKVKQREPEVSVQSAQPEVVLADKEPARVAVRNQEAAQVEVNSAQPQVEVGQGSPDVDINASGGGADVDVRQARPGEQRQQMQMAALDRGEQQRVTQQTREPAANPLDRMRLTELEGKQVLNREGQELGTVDEVVVSRQGNQPGVVIKVGEILGFGGEEVLVPLEQVALSNGRLIWETTMTPEQMRNSRFSDRDYTPVSTSDYNTVGELRQAR